MQDIAMRPALALQLSHTFQAGLVYAKAVLSTCGCYRCITHIFAGFDAMSSSIAKTLDRIRHQGGLI